MVEMNDASIGSPTPGIVVPKQRVIKVETAQQNKYDIREKNIGGGLSGTGGCFVTMGLVFTSNSKSGL